MADHEIDSKNYDQSVSVPTGKTFEVQVNLPDLHIRIHIDPEEASARNDRYTLVERRESNVVRYKRSIQDDMVEGDDYVDLVFKNLRPDAMYSLEVNLVDDDTRYFLFENKEFSELFPRS